MEARTFSWIPLLLGSLLLAAPLGAVTIQDAVFSDADWSTLELIDTSTNDSGVFVGEQSATGGNPDEYWRVVNEVNEAGPSTITLLGAHVYQGDSYDPSVSGAVDTVQFMLDGIGVSGPAGAMGFRALIEQGGMFYVAGLPQVLNGAGWQPLDSGPLFASAFALVVGGGSDPGQNPDFSASGGVLRFGVGTSNGTFGTPSTNEGGIDNWVVTIEPVPEPQAALLLGLGALAIAAHRPRR